MFTSTCRIICSVHPSVACDRISLPNHRVEYLPHIVSCMNYLANQYIRFLNNLPYARKVKRKYQFPIAWQRINLRRAVLSAAFVAEYNNGGNVPVVLSTVPVGEQLHTCGRGYV